LVKGNVEKLNLINRLYVGFDFHLTKNLSLTAGATYNLRIFDSAFKNHADLFTYAKPTVITKGELNDRYNYQGWFGAKVGIRFL
jgi:hypothetical protein